MARLSDHARKLGLLWKAGALLALLSLMMAMALGMVFLPLAWLLSAVCGALGAPLALSSALWLCSIAWLPLALGYAMPIALRQMRDDARTVAQIAELHLAGSR